MPLTRASTTASIGNSSNCEMTEKFMQPAKATQLYTVRYPVLLGLMIGALLGAVSETVVQLRATDASAAALVPTPLQQ